MPSVILNGQTYYYPEGSQPPVFEGGSVKGASWSTDPNSPWNSVTTQTPTPTGGTTTQPPVIPEPVDNSQNPIWGQNPTGAYTAPQGTPTNAAGYGDFDYQAYATANPDAANAAMSQGGDPYSNLYQHYLSNTGNFTPGLYQKREAATASYVDPATGSIRADLLGGKYTDPNTIPPEVLATRLDYRNRGYKGAFGTGEAARWQGQAYDQTVDEYGRPTVLSYSKDEYLNPSLKPGTEFTPTMMQEKPGEILDANQYMLGEAPQATLTQGQVSQVGQAAQATSTDANANTAVDPTKTNAASYVADLVNITPEATVQGQMSALMEQFEDGNIPPWAAGAIRTAQQHLAGRGMGASSIAGEAIVQAAMEASLPIAQADAQVRAQALFSNQAATNAAKQFNATSQQQNDQFFANLKSTVDQFNAAQKNAVEQFNAAQKSQISMFNAQSTNDINKFDVDQKNAMEKFNAEQANAISQFNSALRDSREKFNAENRLVVDQSNATWRRMINTQNNQLENTANQWNAANLLNISNTAMNDLWQNFRDQSDYAFTASENDKTRKQNIALATLQQQQWFERFSAESQQAFSAGLGNLVGTVLGGVIDDIDFGDIFGG